MLPEEKNSTEHNLFSVTFLIHLQPRAISFVAVRTPALVDTNPLFADHLSCERLL